MRLRKQRIFCPSGCCSHSLSSDVLPTSKYERQETIILYAMPCHDQDSISVVDWGTPVGEAVHCWHDPVRTTLHDDIRICHHCRRCFSCLHIIWGMILMCLQFIWKINNYIIGSIEHLLCTSVMNAPVVQAVSKLFCIVGISRTLAVCNCDECPPGCSCLKTLLPRDPDSQSHW